ncbi:MAG: penicillin-binding protein activator [Gammaproteobacteria bacterium]
MTARRPPRPLAAWVIPLLLLLMLGGCAVTPPGKQAAPPSATELLDKARQAEVRGDYEAAAREYLRLAGIAASPQDKAYQLQAARVLLQGNYLEQARRILAALPAEQVGGELLTQRQLLTARIALAENQPQRALQLLRALDPTQQPPAPAVTIHELRAQAYQRVGNLIEVVRERVALAQRLPAENDSRRHENQALIWQTLLRLSDLALQQLRLAPPPDTLSGWLELARIAKQSQRHPQDVAQQVDDWRRRYPDHPVADDIIASLLARQEEAVHRPEHIALLLPHHGPYAKPAAALRNGFLAAHYRRSRQDYRPQIRIYDVGDDAASVAAAYDQALQDGADFIVGPLRKNGVNLLAQRMRLPVATLTLNYSSESGHPPLKLFQFGLAPEDEARQVAERAWLDGNNQALALLPAGPWGQRLLDAFRETWQQLGGTLLEFQFYPPEDNDFSHPIQALLNLDNSKARRQRLEKIIGQALKFEPRRRQDADFVFLGAFPRQARLIRPQLKFHYASKLPVYATSHIFTGKTDRNADRDMDGIIFCDIPWVLADKQNPPPLKMATQTLWPAQAAQYTRFYALGADAYDIIPFLNNLRAYRYERFSGRTGMLSLSEDNRIFRELQWARFRNGIPRAY